LLQLQRTLERYRQPDVAAEEEEERLLVEPLRDLLDRMVAVEELLHLGGEAVDLIEDELDLVDRQRLPRARELEADQVHQPDLRGERLRRGHAHLEPGARVEDRVDLARDL